MILIGDNDKNANNSNDNKSLLTQKDSVMPNSQDYC